MSLLEYTSQRSLFEPDHQFSHLFEHNASADRFRFFAARILPQLQAMRPQLEQAYCMNNGRPGEVISPEKSGHGILLTATSLWKRGCVEDGVLGESGTRGCYRSNEEENFFQFVPFSRRPRSVYRSGGV